MKSIIRIRAALLILLPVYCFVPAPAHAEDVAMVNRPVNTSGLTGMLLTTAPYTLAPGATELAASVLSENSITPDYTITEYPLSVTVGMPLCVSQLASRPPLAIAYSDSSPSAAIAAAAAATLGSSRLRRKDS
jgi:hypothetical protein